MKPVPEYGFRAFTARGAFKSSTRKGMAIHTQLKLWFAAHLSREARIAGSNAHTGYTQIQPHFLRLSSAYLFYILHFKIQPILQKW